MLTFSKPSKRVQLVFLLKFGFELNSTIFGSRLSGSCKWGSFFLLPGKIFFFSCENTVNHFGILSFITICIFTKLLKIILCFIGQMVLFLGIDCIL